MRERRETNQICSEADEHITEWEAGVKIKTFLSLESGVSFFTFKQFSHHASLRAPVGQELHFSLRFRRTRPVVAPCLALTSSHGLLGVGLHHRLLHLRDHQIRGGQELVCGHHQPDRTAAHHYVLCWVSDVCLHVLWVIVMSYYPSQVFVKLCSERG